IGAQLRDLGDERAGDRHGLDPAEPLGGLGLGVRTPQGRVTGGDAGGDEVADELRQRRVDQRGDVAGEMDVEAHRSAAASVSAFVTVACRSCHDAMNLSTPSSSSTWVTSAKSTPSSASWSNT